ncbi:MAG TPA: glycosyltransferase [Burkholderiaceae bacterium]|nr:glycosyltransferase [Burkholderiaceae bacterium]
MRIVYLVSLFPCWSETFIVRELRELIELGVDVRIVSLKSASEKMVQSDARALLDWVFYPVPAWRAAMAAGAALLRHPCRELRDLAEIVRGLGAHRSALAKSLVVWWRTIGLAPAIQRLAPDHIHAHWATYPSTAAMVLSRRIGVPFSFTSHAHDIFLEDHLLGEKLRRSAFGVTISQYNRDFLARRHGDWVRERLKIIHCGVRLDEFPYRPGEREPGFILAVGRLDEIKGFAYLVDACQRLAARGVRFRCRIIGEGPLRAPLQARINANGLADRVQLLGARKQEEVQDALYRADVFVLPSVVSARGDRDGIPVALMEAMAAGTPVVSTRVSGIPELVEDGVTGLLADPGDANGLAEATARLLASPDLAGRLTAAARARVEKEFNVRAEAGKLHQLIAHVDRLH